MPSTHPLQLLLLVAQLPPRHLQAAHTGQRWSLPTRLCRLPQAAMPATVCSLLRISPHTRKQHRSKCAAVPMVRGLSTSWLKCSVPTAPRPPAAPAQ